MTLRCYKLGHLLEDPACDVHCLYWVLLVLNTFPGRLAENSGCCLVVLTAGMTAGHPL